MSQTRRLPVYLLLDTSGSMKGEPLESLKAGLQSMLGALRSDPYALESLFLSVITYDREARVLVPLTSLEHFILPTITAPDSGPTHLGQALELLCKRVDAEVLRSSGEAKGDWRPLLFVMTDGSPSDKLLFKEMTPEVKKRGFASIIGCAAGPKATKEELVTLADHVVTLDTMDGASFMNFFKWVSSTVATGNASMGTAASIQLPPPPAEVNLVL
jgi:uncharacterized protein YegL